MISNNPKIVIVGSGLSAYGAICAAIDLNASITVIDIGDTLPGEISAAMLTIRNVSVSYTHLTLPTKRIV